LIDLCVKCDERQARIQAEADVVAKIEGDRLVALARKAEADALLPDMEKARAWVASIRAMAPPAVKAEKVSMLLLSTHAEIVRFLDGVKLT